MLRLALPNKGRLNEDARSLLADAGLEVRASSDRALVASLGGEFEAIFVRAQDIPEFVADGAADAGITGWDLVCESERPLESLLDLGFGRCRLVVAARDERGAVDLDQVADGARVATVFPRLTQRFFEARGARVQLVPVSGAVEIAPHLGIADVVVDLTSTGSTLRVNGLREIGTLLESTARLIVAGSESGRAPTGARRTALDELVAALRSVLAARSQRYVMANVPRDRLDEVRRILPGISGPTVIDVMNGGSKVAVHAVCPSEGIYRTINALKAVGGEGILVTRIERLMA
ncbi:MAG: ATP phosphoribosyltransferase [Gemmatimonadales bacterium]|nr:ATP phosphoribosyltransferase [Gemmatimonadales bacterium]